MAPIAVGDQIPDGKLSYFNKEGELKTVSIHELAAKKKVVLVGVPGAFTPVCSLKHVPGFLEQADELKAKGVEEILCMTVNDPFVVREWAKSYGDAAEKITFLADGSGVYTKALGVELDLTEKGLGLRARRFAFLLDDLVVKVANLEEGGSFEVSSAEDLLKAL